MDGILGVLKQDGKQVAGIYDWEINLAWDSTTSKGWQKVKVVKHVIAQSYWLTEIPQDSTYDIELYKKIDGQLVLMDAGVIAINLPDTETLDRRLYAPLQLIWRQPSEY
uniref:Uncharacterized protein n=1 Tax=viral metagenome TaxID=1070528 RepID=A0A6M3KYU9_9ZZZZ